MNEAGVTQPFEGDHVGRWLAHEIEIRVARALDRAKRGTVPDLSAAVRDAVAQAHAEVSDGLVMIEAQRRADCANPQAVALDRAEAVEFARAALASVADT